MQNNGNISVVRQFLRKRWVKVILAIDTLAIFAVIGVIIWNATKTATINFNIAPIDAKIQIDGRGDYANGSYQVHPGTYDIAISRDGLETKTFTLDLKSGYVATLTAFLAGPDNNFDFYTLRDNYASLQKLEEIAGSQDNQTTDHDTSAEDFIQIFQHNFAIYDILPIVDSTPTSCGLSCGANYQSDTLTIADGRAMEQCALTLCLYITDTSGDKKDFALSVVEKLGYDIDMFQILYEKVSHEQN